MKVKIYGAGSIGNHLGHACRNKGWDVLMCDSDPAALERTKQDIYPSRYGAWDEAIRLVTPDQLPDEDFDLVIIGTPPDSHLAIAKSHVELACVDEITQTLVELAKSGQAFFGSCPLRPQFLELTFCCLQIVGRLDQLCLCLLMQGQGFVELLF